MVDKVRTAVLGQLTNWLPTIEDHGEGMWIQLDTAALADREARPETARRADVLRSGWNRELGDVPTCGSSARATTCSMPSRTC